MADGVRVPKGNIGRVVSAEAPAADCHLMSRAFAAREVEHVANDHLFECVMGAHSIGRVNRFVVKTLQIDRVWAVDRDFAIVDEPRQGADESQILIFVITGARRREKNQWQPAAVSENEHFKFTAQPRCVPFDVTFVHIGGVISSEAGGEVEKSLVRSSAYCPSPQSSPHKRGEAEGLSFSCCRYPQRCLRDRLSLSKRERIEVRDFFARSRDHQRWTNSACSTMRLGLHAQAYSDWKH